MSFTETIIEQAALDWFQGLEYSYAFGPDLRDTLLPYLMTGEI